MRPYNRVYATVNLDAVADNMKEMAGNLPSGTGMIGVVKADGYGHGSVPVAMAVDPYVRGFAVATVEEGVILRRHGIGKMILVLGVTHPDQYGELIRYQIRPTVFTLRQAERLSELACREGVRAKLHLAVDTGMSRIGMEPDEASAEMVLSMSRLPGIEIEGMFTHFARADERDKESARAQLAAYLNFSELLKSRGIEIPLKHCSNSAGIVEGLPSNSLDLVRAGISIYGLYPSDEVDRETVHLTPVMELKSRISYIKTIRPGTPVSYGGTFVARRPTRIATIPVGYGDGYPRSLSSRGSVLIRGRRAPILGRVCMDQFMVDVTDIPEAEEEDEVTLIGRDGGDQISVEELARLGGGFHYELICDLGKRVPRVYLRGGRIAGTKDYFQDVYEGFRRP
ncbi:alanine racemase [Enterocloster asparagiformis]|uniref:alanine racemase n=1 Tax=Enterocloster asparagiformis TaxID=333367 RepID=UPI002A81429E|nr:alanine racemase [Enterocloster asparagiformis]